MAELGSQPTPVQSLYSLFAENKLYVNRRYQRKLVWTLEEKQKLIESILKKYPIPAVLIAGRENEPGTFEIIDGLQRLHAIVSFIETAFPTLDGKLFNLDFFTTAKNRSNNGAFIANTGEQYLTEKEVSPFLDYVLSLSIMRNATEAEINDVFGRINTYGHRLSDQERRQAGVQNEFSEMVRNVACTMRGDVSTDVLTLEKMPSISIDLPMTKHGYTVKAEEVFWVTQGILRSTDLRDSMDEQCIADVAACVVGGQIVDRSKEELDEIYTPGSPSSERIINALGVYGPTRFAEEFKFSVDEILKVADSVPSENGHLRDLLFKKKTSNAFPSVFAVLLIAFHEMLIKESKVLIDYPGARKALEDLNTRIDTSRKATSPDERRKNIDTVKGLIESSFAKAEKGAVAYGNHASADIEGIIRRSEIELADYELKQGYLTLSDKRSADTALIDKVIKTICAIANNGPNRIGKLIIGVTDKESDAARIVELDKIAPKKVGKRFVVGINREAKVLGKSVEDYYAMWKNAIKASGLSAHLRDSVLSNIDFNGFYGLGVIIVTIPPQKELSYVNDEVYWREGDSTLKADTAKQIAALAQRF
jgi:hypothetical protein